MFKTLETSRVFGHEHTYETSQGCLSNTARKTNVKGARRRRWNTYGRRQQQNIINSCYKIHTQDN